MSDFMRPRSQQWNSFLLHEKIIEIVHDVFRYVSDALKNSKSLSFLVPTLRCCSVKDSVFSSKLWLQINFIFLFSTKSWDEPTNTGHFFAGFKQVAEKYWGHSYAFIWMSKLKRKSWTVPNGCLGHLETLDRRELRAQS